MIFSINCIFLTLFHLNSDCGYDNALSFKTVDDTDIAYIEEHIKKKAFITVPNDLKSLINIFGRSYATNSKKFQFHLGDIKLIKMLAEHVKKVVDEHGMNKGLDRFKSIQKNTDSSAIDIERKLSNMLEQTNLNDDDSQTHYFLKKLLAAADKNSQRKPGGYRYEEEIKLFAAYLRMLIGPLAYETLHRNLECALPALTSVNRYIRASNCNISEGILRCHELKIYLTEHGADLCVNLSEDATRTIGRVQHDSRTNQLVGFVLPLGDENGMPIPFQYPATNASEIINHFSGKNDISSFLNVVMAQPIDPNIPAFCLLIFGSNNKYTSHDVRNRWKYIVNELAKVNIKVLTISSDSDPKFNATMRELSKLGSNSSQFPEWFSCGETYLYPFYIQDMIHIATKLRNWLLRTFLDLKLLPFGNFFIRVEHLFDLLRKVSKDKHLLTPSTLNPTDRQNFKSVKLMCDPRVIKCLRDNVPGSEATIQFLQMIRNIIDSYMDRDLSPIQRIRQIWFSIFLIRIWRQFIVSSKNYNLKDHFLTANCYSCVELNAHALVLSILHLRNENKAEWFLPHLFESQPCESIFRQFRSLSSVNSTVVNCTTKEAISRISKIHFQNKITHTTSSQFKYPRLKKDTEKKRAFFKLPSKEEIIHEIELCQKAAIITAEKFGLIDKKHKTQNNYVCKVKPYKPKQQHTKQIIGSPIKYIRKFQMKDLKNIQLKDWTGKMKQNIIDKSSLYTEVTCRNGKTVLVKKSSLCWLLNPDQRKLSSDRLRRVRFSAERKQKLNRKRNTQRKITSKKIGHPYIPQIRKRRNHFA